MSADIALSPWRGEELPLAGGGFVINDAYNANPDSMRAALEHLADRAGERRKVAILGEMAELGEGSARSTAEIGALAKDLGVDVVGVGERARATTPSPGCPTRSTRPKPPAPSSSRATPSSSRRRAPSDSKASQAK